LERMASVKPTLTQSDALKFTQNRVGERSNLRGLFRLLELAGTMALEISATARTTAAATTPTALVAGRIRMALRTLVAAALPFLTNAIAGSKLHFKLNDLIPLRIGTLAFGNRQQLPQTPPGVRHGRRLRYRLGRCGLRLFCRQIFWIGRLVHEFIIAQLGFFLEAAHMTTGTEVPAGYLWLQGSSSPG
jgi:hypothetical protein